MAKIAFLVPHAPLVPVIDKVIAPYEQMCVEYCGDYDAVLDFVADLAKRGYEIVIARAGTASRIRKSKIDVAVVELQVTGFDIIRAIRAAKALGKNVALVAYAAMVRGSECLDPWPDFAVRRYLTEADDAEVEPMIANAIADGADVVVGGGVFCQVAEKHGLPAVFINNGEESIQLAIAEALRMEAAIDAEKLKRSLADAILDHVHDGIITVDEKQEVTRINRRARQILGLAEDGAVGCKLDAIWPGLSVAGVIRDKREESNKVLPLGEGKLLCNKAPILVNQDLSGVLVTFQEIARIQQAEANIRKAVYNRGHIAQNSFADIQGKSAAIRRVITLARKYAATRSNVLIMGETGTGKEIFAQSIHNCSSRKSGPFVAVNCAALPAQLLESELFGYAGGAFTGANKEGKPGLFELAHGGTVFLDEIAEMDYTNQSRLLRVLQERSVMRLGSDRIIAVDVRVIAATNKGLKERVRDGKFREDLFFRLNVLKLELPPLRERKADIRDMAEHFLRKFATQGTAMKLDDQAVQLLENYDWPGNVRELQNAAERMLASCQNSTVSAADVTAALEKWDAPMPKAMFRDAEVREIVEALNRARGVQSEAAKLLGIDRTTLWRKMRRLGIEV